MKSQTTKDGGHINTFYLLFTLILLNCAGLYPYQVQRESRCENGDGDACYRVGLEVRNKTHKSPVDAFEWFKRGCAFDNVDSCASAGKFSQERKKPLAIQIKFRTKACNLGHGYSCTQAGLLTKSQPAHSLKLYQKGCDLNRYDACHLAAINTHERTPESRQKRTILFDKSCTYQTSCSSFASSLVRGRGVEKDVKRGNELLKNLCARKIARSCQILGLIIFGELKPQST